MIHLILQNPLFRLGEVVATPGAVEALETHNIQPLTLLQRHVTGDWGDVCEEDAQSNTDAVTYGERILSSYRIAEHTRVWIITEWDRSVTTLLLPSEY
jgi:hypothetical protein